MTRLSTPPNPVQPWHVLTADGTYWQDCEGDFYPEFLGATTANPDCSTALQNAFRAHMFLKMRLRGMGNTYNCTNQVHFDTLGFSDGGCDADFNGLGRSRILFAPGVPSPCFLLASSVAQNDFWGRFVNLDILANTNGLAAQFGRSDHNDPSNDFEINVNVANYSTGSATQAILMNSFYSSPLNIIGNCGGKGTGHTAVQLNSCNMCRGFIGAGQCTTGLAFANHTNGNTFTADIESLTTGIVQLDPSCGYTEILNGVIANVDAAIDNHLGGPLRLRNALITGETNIFANPTANNTSWGGFAVTLDSASQYPTGFTPGAIPQPNIWVLNKSAQPQWVSFYGTSTSDVFQVHVRYWYDFTSAGIRVANVSPCGFVLRPGEQVSYSSNGTKSYSWSWRPLI
jgi:hypothetical protein